jgi:Family of unknown function (DUF6785)/Domain of unknown function (DUF6784)
MSTTGESQQHAGRVAVGEPPRGFSRATPLPACTTGVSVRALLIGALLIPVVCIFNEYTEIVAEGTDMVAMSLIIAVVILLFLLVMINLGLKKWAPRFAFSQAELMYIYVMLTVSVGISGIGMTQFLVPQLGNLYHFANETNKWDQFWPYVPHWFVPDRAVLPAFYASQSSFYTWEHFRGWLTPILTWSSFIVVMLFCMLCMNVIIRRQWMDRERLTFPIVYLPLEMTRGGGSVELFTNRWMWIGFAIPCVLETLASLNYLFPSVPSLPLKPSTGLEIGPYFTDAPWSAVGYLTLAFYPLVIGIAYFLSLEVSFSSWFFYLFTKVQSVAATAFGFQDSQASAAAKRIPYLPEQGAGAFIGLALFGAYASRRYLREVLRKAFSGAPEIRDDNEPMPYRLAVFGLLGGLLALCAFMTAAGLAWYLVLIFFVLYFILVLTFTRIRAEAGQAWGFGPNNPAHRLMLDTGGSYGWSLQNLTVFSYLMWMDLDYRCVAMPHQLEGFKIGESARMNSRHLAAVIMLATVIGALASFWALLVIYYKYGAGTAKVNGWRTDMGSRAFNDIRNWFDNPERLNAPALQATLVGVGVTGLLMALRTHFTWWPFHPVGYALAGTFTMDWLWFPTLVGWLIKALTIRYGGMKMYRAFIPFFIGLILGDYVIGGLWALIGLAFDIRVYRCFPI